MKDLVKKEKLSPINFPYFMRFLDKKLKSGKKISSQKQQKTGCSIVLITAETIHKLNFKPIFIKMSYVDYKKIYQNAIFFRFLHC